MMEIRPDFGGHTQTLHRTYTLFSEPPADQLDDPSGLGGWYAPGALPNNFASLDCSHLALNLEFEDNELQLDYTGCLRTTSGPISDYPRSAFCEYADPAQTWRVPLEGTDLSSLPLAETEEYTDQQSDTNYIMEIWKNPNASIIGPWDGVPTSATPLEADMFGSIEYGDTSPAINGLSPAFESTLPEGMEDSLYYYASQDQIPPQPTKNTLPTLAVNTGAKYPCPAGSCEAKKPFARKADLERHIKTAHVRPPLEDLFPCRIGGCGYTGLNGFVRRDKLLLHQKRAHQGSQETGDWLDPHYN
ncbi:hypothetical protein FGG08_003984 [Glutinoglossum americanum]|uniref:C2H2-type domain-containing protein n=1 Tax=Glutinoglossum americanum TaxID=1670608 RepID=A0A9P8I6M0_9PEZI|nr:hypothetical protein FGG08_003984 [Glutinoglossum americanum]